MLQLDANAAARYVDLLTGDRDTVVTLQTFDDTAQKRRELAAIRSGTLKSLWPWVCAQQELGCGVFVTVNDTTPGKRTAADVLRVRALFCDFDGTEPDPDAWHWAPSMVVQSGHGKHAYWVIVPSLPALGVPLAEFKPSQLRLATHYGSDLKVHDLPRVMRLPGTWHQKDAVPVLVTIAEVSPLRYTWPMVLDRIADLPLPPMRPREPERKAEDRSFDELPYLDLSTFDVRRMFEDAGLLLCESRTPGRWFVHCPWSASHTGGKVTATSTVIFEGPRPGFWCSHNGCDGRTIRDVRETLDDRALSRYCQRWEGRRATRATTDADTRERGLLWTK